MKDMIKAWLSLSSVTLQTRKSLKVRTFNIVKIGREEIM